MVTRGAIRRTSGAGTETRVTSRPFPGHLDVHRLFPGRLCSTRPKERGKTFCANRPSAGSTDPIRAVLNSRKRESHRRKQTVLVIQDAGGQVAMHGELGLIGTVRDPFNCNTPALTCSH